ncbi:MAG TPA: heavy metal translocating P-type ATPase, partial [Nocardioides bacterium]|nr:heavy metal translocating P-type ATPase [Nocardioides sp.]
RPPEVEAFTSTQGLGVAGVVEGHAVVAGRPGWLASQWSQPLDARLAGAVQVAEQVAEQQGRTVIAAGWDGEARGVLVVSDTIKPTSAQAVAELKQLGLRPVLLTGDNER